MKLILKKFIISNYNLSYISIVKPSINKLMKNFFYLLIITLCLWGCKKKKDDIQAIDYSCDCSKYGTNIINFSFYHPLKLYPANNDRGNWGFIDSKGNMVISPMYKETLWFSNNRARVLIDFYGFIATDGTMAVPDGYRYIGAYFSANGLVGYASDVMNWGFMDMNGKNILPFLYKDADPFHEDSAVVNYMNRFGAIDIAGNLKVPNQYMVVGTFSEGKAYAATLKGWLGYIGPNNEQIISSRFAAAGIFINGYAVVMDTVNFLYGYINGSGNYMIPPSFQDAGPFWEYLAGVKVGNKWGFVDTLGNMVIQPAFDDVLSGFCENLTGIKMGDTWGYADKTGQIVIQPQFKEIDMFYCGLAMVLFEDGHMGYIDKSGNIIWKSPILSLKNTLGTRRHIDNFRNTVTEKAILPRIHR